MTIVNGYATLAEYKIYQRVSSTDVNDDAYIEDAIEAASRWIDRESAQRFYTASETRKYDTPISDVLLFDEYFSSVTSVTNGDGTAVLAAQYVTLPQNGVPIYGLQMRRPYVWMTNSGDPLGAISVAGSVGYASTAPDDIHLAALEIAKSLYGRRMGENLSTKTIITPAGVVQIPDGVPDWAAMTIGHYKKLVYG